MSIEQSKILSFLSDDKKFSLYVFEGQEIIKNLAVIHDVKKDAFNFLRDSVLSSVHMTNFLKPGESTGLYLDNEEPEFMLKVELDSNGHIRCLLLPEKAPEVSPAFYGTIKVTKFSPFKAEPYSSIVALENSSFRSVMNWVFKQTYQVNAQSSIAGLVDRSLMMMKLPPLNPLEEESEHVSDTEFYDHHHHKLMELMEDYSLDSSQIKEKLESNGWMFLKEKEISYSCQCSRDRMLSGVISLLKVYSKEELFEGKDHIETKCDYCKTYYLIQSSEV